MDTIIIVCAVIWVAVAAACMFGHSQAVQRMGCIELILAAAVGGCAMFGYWKAADFTSRQYHQMLAISLGSTDPYLADLEDELEVYGGSDAAFLQESERIVEDALPVLQSGEARYTFCKIFLVKKESTGGYRECFFTGSADQSWESLQETVKPLIGRAMRSRETVWQECENEMTVFVAADKSRIAPAYALVVLASRKPLLTALNTLKTQYFFYSLLFLITATLLVIRMVLMQEKELHRIIRLLSRVAQGLEDDSTLSKLVGKSLSPRASNETHALYSSLLQIVVSTERMNYSKYQVLQAYYRFAPREIEKILGRHSILDVAPSDWAETRSTVAFVSFAKRKGISDKEYLRQMNRNYALLCEGRREFGGSIVSGGSNPDVMLLLFYDESRKALQFGVKMAIREVADQKAGQAFVFLHRTPLVYGVAGDDEQSFPYLYSEEIRILQKYADSLRAMGVRMVVTDCVWEMVKEGAVSRYIGYIEDGKYLFHLYEILDAHPVKERLKRIAFESKFQEALHLFYKSDFYLARNIFSDILRSCPMDEVAKWYLFLCESGLSSEKAQRKSFALFSGE